MDLPRIFAMTEGDIYLAETPDFLAQSWAYTHLMLFGKTSLTTYYKRWIKLLAKARGIAPPLKLGSYTQAKEDLKKYALKHWETK